MTMLISCPFEKQREAPLRVDGVRGT